MTNVPYSSRANGGASDAARDGASDAASDEASDAASDRLYRTSGAILLVAVSFSVCEELCGKVETGDYAKSSRR